MHMNTFILMMLLCCQPLQSCVCANWIKYFCTSWNHHINFVVVHLYVFNQFKWMRTYVLFKAQARAITQILKNKDEFLPSADYKVVCRRPWNHFLPPTSVDFIEIGYLKASSDTFADYWLTHVCHVWRMKVTVTLHCHTTLSCCHTVTLSNCHAVTPKSQFL
jgi:hypothetical protein